MSKKTSCNPTPDISAEESLKRIKEAEKNVLTNMGNADKTETVQSQLNRITMNLTVFRTFVGVLHTAMELADSNYTCKEWLMKTFGLYPSSVALKCAEVENEFFDGYFKAAIHDIVGEYVFGKVGGNGAERKPAPKSKPTSKKNKTPNKKRKH